MGWNRDKERRAAKKMTIASSLFGIAFLIFWCIMAASMGAWVMLLFGIPMLGLMIYRFILCLQLSKEDEDSTKAQDPWDAPPPQPRQEENFCPYCSYPLQPGFAFCPKCGRKLSQ